MIEFSYDQGVYAKAQEVWGSSALTPAERRRARTSTPFATG